ncbi:MAG: hypothetical protein M0R17_03040 [Candidatus Omnitrophica bacterium]|nr:hypothetical protein [Candidatus Omnitrophota bacterium]
MTEIIKKKKRISIAASKSKGRRLSQRIAELIRTTFNLSEDCVYPTPGGVPGEDIKLSEKARECIPFSIENKNQEKLNIWSALKQAESDNRKHPPLLIFSRNHSEDYCALKFSDFIKLLKELKDTKDKLNMTNSEFDSYIKGDV